MSLRATLVLDPTDRVTFLRQFVCRLLQTAADGYSLLMLEDSARITFVTHRELLHLLLSGQLRVETGYFSGMPESMPTRHRPIPMRSEQHGHSANGRVH